MKLPNAACAVNEVEFTDKKGRAFAELALRADQFAVLRYEPAMV
jgi:hypothetical protein